MASDSIGDKLRAMEERAREHSAVPENRPENKEKAEGSRENVKGSGVSNRPAEEERKNQDKVPPRGSAKGTGHA